PGGVQLMTLGSGAEHSEQNGSKTDPMEFLQLWILPDTAGLPPSLQQRQFTAEERTDRLLKVIGPTESDPVRVHQDVAVYVSRLEPGRALPPDCRPGRWGSPRSSTSRRTTGCEPAEPAGRGPGYIKHHALAGFFGRRGQAAARARRPVGRRPGRRRFRA